MSFEAETYYRIEAYVRGELKGENLTAFEQELSGNPSLQAEVEKHSIAHALIIEQRLLSVKNILQEEKSKSVDSIKTYVVLALAAAIISIGAAVFFRTKNNVPAAQQNNAASSTAVPVQKNEKNNGSVSPYQSAGTTEPDKMIYPDNGFHKQAIQQIEQQRNLIERIPASIDTVAAVLEKKAVLAVDSKEKEKENVQNTHIDPCGHVKIQATIKALPSCAHIANGNILVQGIQGGTKPYAVSFSSKTQELIRNGELTKGAYQVVITDAADCIQEFSNIRIEEKECAIDYSFNPFTGEKWHIEAHDSDGRLEIFNKGGVLYYQAIIESKTESEWSGIGSGNQIVPGYYIFVLKYSDGTVKKGSVTIVQ